MLGIWGGGGSQGAYFNLFLYNKVKSYQTRKELSSDNSRIKYIKKNHSTRQSMFLQFSIDSSLNVEAFFHRSNS